MIAKKEKKTAGFFTPYISDMIDSNDPLILLSDKIKWETFETEFKKYYSNNGRPAKPIRMMVGLLMLKYLENLSDERVVAEYKRNMYYQYFCGEEIYQPSYPCNPTELVKFRQRIGKEGVNLILKQTILLFDKKLVQEKEVIIDTTTQEKNITYPTDQQIAFLLSLLEF